MKDRVLGGAFLIVMLLWGGALLYERFYSPYARQLARIHTREARTIRAADLVAYYLANKARADKRYKRKKIYLRGHIKRIYSKPDGHVPTIWFHSSRRYFRGECTVECAMENADGLQNLHEGDWVTLYGTVIGLSPEYESVDLYRCTLPESIERMQATLQRLK